MVTYRHAGRRFAKGSERPENAMLWRFQRRAGGSPGPIAKPFARARRRGTPRQGCRDNSLVVSCDLGSTSSTVGMRPSTLSHSQFMRISASGFIQ